MIFSDTINLLRRCEHYNQAYAFLKEIIALGNNVHLYSNDEIRIIDSQNEKFEFIVNSLMNSFAFCQKYEFHFWCLELYNDDEIICAIQFEDESVEISEKYYDRCYSILNSMLISDSLYKLIDINAILNSKTRVEIMLNSFEYLRTLDCTQTVRLPFYNIDFSYDIYKSELEPVYPKFVMDCFEKLKEGDWSKNNYNQVLYCNYLVIFALGRI